MPDAHETPRTVDWPLGPQCYTYKAQLVEVIDGDTYDFRADLGFRVHKKVRIRMFGIDTAEIYGVPEESDEFALGNEHMDAAELWFARRLKQADVPEWPLEISVLEETGRYGRWVGVVRGLGQDHDDTLTLRDFLISEYPNIHY